MATASKTLQQAMKDIAELNPNVGTYIHLATVFQESGASRNECKKAFLYYMPKEEYDTHESDEMIDYLFKISTEVPE